MDRNNRFSSFNTSISTISNISVSFNTSISPISNISVSIQRSTNFINFDLGFYGQAVLPKFLDNRFDSNNPKVPKLKTCSYGNFHSKLKLCSPMEILLPYFHSKLLQFDIEFFFKNFVY